MLLHSGPLPVLHRVAIRQRFVCKRVRGIVSWWKMSSVVFNYGLHQLQADAAARSVEINRAAMFCIIRRTVRF